MGTCNLKRYDIVNKGSLCPLPRNNRYNRDSRPDRGRHTKSSSRAGQGRAGFSSLELAQLVR